MTKPASNNAILLSCDGNYLTYLNALLNSLEKHQIDADVWIYTWNFPNKKYLKDITSAFSFNVEIMPVNEDEFPVKDTPNKNLFIKQIRFKHFHKVAVHYEAVCLLDADMFVLTSNFNNLFELVKGTRKLIGCNERFKWTFGPRYLKDDKPIFDKDFRAMKFHCSVPIFFDCNEWRDVLEHYNTMVGNSYELKDGKQKTLGDMFCWNISVYKCGREHDVILFPMETMTQVHNTLLANPTRLLNSGGVWHTWNGDEVFCFHGRIKKPWKDKQLELLEKNFFKGLTNDRREKMKRDTNSTINKIAKEYEDLSYNGTIDLRNYGLTIY